MITAVIRIGRGNISVWEKLWLSCIQIRGDTFNRFGLFFVFLKKSYAATPMYVSNRRYSATQEAITIQIPAS